MRVAHKVTGAAGLAGPLQPGGPFDGALAPEGWRHVQFDDGLACFVPDRLLVREAA